MSGEVFEAIRVSSHASAWKDQNRIRAAPLPRKPSPEPRTESPCAEAILRDGGVISVRVLNELTNVARRKMRMTWPDTHAFPSMPRGLLTVQAITVETHETGLALARRHGLSLHDAMIVASAVHADCGMVWPEDMRHGMVVGQELRIVNPFRVPG